ncbi:unnamed protein product [Arabidopsis halleri]
MSSLFRLSPRFSLKKNIFYGFFVFYDGFSRSFPVKIEMIYEIAKSGLIVSVFLLS